MWIGSMLLYVSLCIASIVPAEVRYIFLLYREGLKTS